MATYKADEAVELVRDLAAKLTSDKSVFSATIEIERRSWDGKETFYVEYEAKGEL